MAEPNPLYAAVKHESLESKNRWLLKKLGRLEGRNFDLSAEAHEWAVKYSQTSLSLRQALRREKALLRQYEELVQRLDESDKTEYFLCHEDACEKPQTQTQTRCLEHSPDEHD